jgi:hypothetical protein
MGMTTDAVDRYQSFLIRPIMGVTTEAVHRHQTVILAAGEGTMLALTAKDTVNAARALQGRLWVEVTARTEHSGDEEIHQAIQTWKKTNLGWKASWGGPEPVISTLTKGACVALSLYVLKSAWTGSKV